MIENGATVTTACAHCQNRHEMQLSAVHLQMWDTGLNSRLEFFCLECHSFNSKPVEEHAIYFLVKYGARKTVQHVPLEVLELKGGPVITEDEIDDFIIELEMAEKMRRPLEGPRMNLLDPRASQNAR